MKITIIGGGVAGLVCAHMLHCDHELVVFEASEEAGGHTNTVHVETETGASDLDTGFIVFNDRNYQRFERLLDELGVPTQPSQMSFGVRRALSAAVADVPRLLRGRLHRAADRRHANDAGKAAMAPVRGPKSAYDAPQALAS